MPDVTALGEILIDFTPERQEVDENPSFVANPGGAPGNVMVALSQLGKSSAFIGSVGRDQFGEMLKQTLEERRVDTSGMVYADVPTTLAFVHIDADGDRSFSFYRNPGADMMLTKDDLNLALIKDSRIFHVGSISMTDEPVREATLTALMVAKENGVFVSYDPNLRAPLWKSLVEAKKNILEVMAFADIVKLSDEELTFLTGEKDITLGVEKLLAEHAIPVLFVTLGAKGSYCFSAGESVFVPGLTVYAIDTTGCGDAFFGGVLYQLLELDLLGANLTKKEMRTILTFGNAMGALVATTKGAIPAMPTLNEIQTFTQTRK